MSHQPKTLTGGCHCRALRYTAHLPGPSSVRQIYYCHCSTCRRLSGSAYLPFLELDTDAFRWTTTTTTEGPLAQSRLYHDLSPSTTTTTTAAAPLGTHVSNVATRTFCTRCGTPLTMFYPAQPGALSVTMGSLDDGGLEGLAVREEAGGSRREDEVRLVEDKALHIFGASMQAWGDPGVQVKVPVRPGMP